MDLGTKVFAGSFNFYRDGSWSNPVSYQYAQDLDADGVEEVVFVAFETQPNTAANYSNTSVHIFGWSDGRFQDLTQRWLPGGASLVEGVGDVAFGDFNGDGRVDMFTSAYTDMDHPVNAYAFYNQGGYFSRVSMGLQTWQHSLRSADINHDGYADVLPTGYATMPRYLGSAAGLIPMIGFTGGSGIALGDFMGNGTTAMVLVDAGSGRDDTFVYAFDFKTPGAVSVERVSQLPAPRLETIAPTASSHDIRAVPFDFDDDGRLDVIVVSWAFGASSTVTHRGELQFLRNQGAGQFVDVTDTYRIGWDTAGYTGYTPQLVDVNRDGLLDLFVSQPDWLATYNSTSLLLQQQGNTFNDTARDALRQAVGGGGAQGALVKGPSGQYYLVTEAPWNAPDPNTEIYLQAISFPERDLPEQLRGTRRNDMIDGMGGIDTVVYDTALAHHQVRLQRATRSVTIVGDASTTDGTDTLLNVERLQFAGQVFDLYNAPATQAPAYRQTSSFLFDGAYYLLSNPQLAASLTTSTAVNHFLSTGAALGYKPNSWFDPVYYANRWSDLKPAGLDAATLFQHYNLYGVWEGRSAGPAFDLYDGGRYLRDNPDVAAYVDARIDDFLGSRTNGAIAHYVIYGADEGRLAYDLSSQPIDAVIVVGVAV